MCTDRAEPSEGNERDAVDLARDLSIPGGCAPQRRQEVVGLRPAHRGADPRRPGHAGALVPVRVHHVLGRGAGVARAAAGEFSADGVVVATSWGAGRVRRESTNVLMVLEPTTTTT